MTTAAKLLAEAENLRGLMLTVTDPEALTEIKLMIEELERRARELGNGDASAERLIV